MPPEKLSDPVDSEQLEQLELAATKALAIATSCLARNFNYEQTRPRLKRPPGKVE